VLKVAALNGFKTIHLLNNTTIISAAFTHEAIGSGLVDMSPAYLDYLNDRLATLHTQQPTVDANLIREIQARTEEEQPPEPTPRAPRPNSALVSAPVSREIPSVSGRRESGRTTLTAQEKDAARIAGVSLETYARQKIKYEAMKESGEYGDQR
jgi:hypothetical protein